MAHSSEMSLAQVQALIDTYDTLDREDCKAAMVKVAIACNGYGATAIMLANQLQDLSMERGNTLFGFSKTECKSIEQNAKLIKTTLCASLYTCRKIEKQAALRQICPELLNNNNLPQDPKILKELRGLIERCGYQLACCFLRDAMYRRFQALVGNGRHKSGSFLRIHTKDITWAAKQSQLHGRPAPDTPAVLFEQRDGMPQFVCDRPYDLRKLLGKALLEQAAEPAVNVPNTSRPGAVQPESTGTDVRAIDTTARENDSNDNETPPPVIKTKTRKQPARKVNVPLAQTLKPAQKVTETPPWYTKGGKRPAPPPESMPSPKRQAAHLTSATSQEQQDYTHLRAPMPSSITLAIAGPQMLPTELMPPPQKQKSHTLSLSPEHAQSRSGAPTPCSIIPEVAKPEMVHYYWEPKTSASPFIKEESTVENGAVLGGCKDAYAESGRMSEEIRPGSTGALQQNPASQGDGGEGTYNNVVGSLQPPIPVVAPNDNRRSSWVNTWENMWNPWKR
ncbi:hypothetical protein LTR97_004050 [Elasticomyces elasticus]|uniref:Uncharacterized protein n=1 Tax=Elasticomyces elasticus TaxID=574655 RepID=A0AAN7WCH8_9PEZI|nr:hypothetical protein LTR97_004050 [Elasticomyces elasticus]